MSANYKGTKQIGFLHSLAVRKLEAYKKEMDRKGYIHNDEDPLFIPYRQKRRLKPMSVHSIEASFTDASVMALG